MSATFCTSAIERVAMSIAHRLRTIRLLEKAPTMHEVNKIVALFHVCLHFIDTCF